MSRYKPRSHRTVKRRAAPEKVVMRDIRYAAESLGFDVDDMTQPRRSMMPLGLPDYRLRHRAKRFRCWVEVKAPGGKVSVHQTAWHALERDCGGVVIVADSVDAFVEGLAENGFPVGVR